MKKELLLLCALTTMSQAMDDGEVNKSNTFKAVHPQTLKIRKPEPKSYSPLYKDSFVYHEQNALFAYCMDELEERKKITNKNNEYGQRIHEMYDYILSLERMLIDNIDPINDENVRMFIRQITLNAKPYNVFIADLVNKQREVIESEYQIESEK